MPFLNGKNLIEFGEFQLDADKNVLRRRGEIVSLPLKAVELLGVLVENPGDVVTKDELMSRVWAGAFVEESVLTQNIYLLRKTLKAGGGGDPIRTVSRRGYVFTADARTADRHQPMIERHVAERISLDVEEHVARPAGRRAMALLGLAACAIAIAGGAFLLKDRRGTAIADSPPKAPRLAPPSAASGYKSVLVLPFSGGDASAARTFSGDLAARLGGMNKFDVKPPAVLAEYEAHGATARPDLVVRGSYERKGRLGVVAASLADASGAKLWSGAFEYELEVQLQDAAANAIGAEIVARMTDGEREMVANRLPSNLAAYVSHRDGLAMWRRRLDSKPLFMRAVEMDSSFAPAYAHLAGAYAMASLRSPEAERAEELLGQAFELDPYLADAYAVQGFIRMFHHHDWAGAEASLKGAVALDQRNVNARHWLGIYYAIHRRLEEAKAELGAALDSDPTHPTVLADLGLLRFFAGERDAAAEQCGRALAIDPENGFAGHCLTRARAEVAAEDPETLLAEAERAAADRHFTLPYINVDPRYDAVRGHARFRAVLKRIGLDR